MSILEKLKSHHDLIKDSELELNQKIKELGVENEIRKLLKFNDPNYKFDFRIHANHKNEVILLLLIFRFSVDKRDLLMLSAKNINLTKRRIVQKGDSIQKLSGKTRRLLLSSIIDNQIIMNIANNILDLHTELLQYEVKILKEVQELFKDNFLKEKFHNLYTSDNMLSFKTKDNSEILSFMTHVLSNEGEYILNLISNSSFGLTQDELSKLKELLTKN